MENKYSDVGQRIFLLRSRQKLTREQLAESAEISVQFLSDIEKGRKNMTVTTVRKIAAALNVTTDYIINGRNEPHPDGENELTEIYRTLSDDDKSRAREILRLFAQSARR